MKTVSYRQSVLLLVLLQGAAMPALAGLEQECHQEAADYGVDAELLDQYIQDCMYTRGGYPDTGTDAMLEQPAQDPVDGDMADPSALSPGQN